MEKLERYARRCAVGVSSLVGAMLVTSACTTFRPTAGTDQELQSRILAGELLAEGDRVRLTTDGGRMEDFRIDALDLAAGTISGGQRVVSVADVAGLEQRVRAPGKTWGLVGGLAVLLFGVECEDDPSCDLGYGGNCC